ncbi:MAG: hypothetical protein C4527_11325 [Candidatus Omnitrophota bacterium]|jgi:hypothetical protein|nr:MAG: hypothetical protein C4527_11325 [Candidatus Omnitrophota bacterium]
MNLRYLLFLGILLFTFGIRYYGLADNPPGFFRDEADKGYTTYSLLLTGKDQTGKCLPIFTRALNVTTSAVYQYLDLPFIAALGLNEQAVRLPACLAGTFSVMAAFLLARRWWGTIMGLWAGLFVCLSPWSILLSRWANQSILLTLWIPLAVFFFVSALEKDRGTIPRMMIASFLFLLALYTYAPARLFIPVFVLLIWVICICHRDPAQEKRGFLFQLFFIFAGIFLIGLIPFAYHQFFEATESTARLSRISIFDGRPLFSIFSEFLYNYALHLSPSFLFVHGDANLRHNTTVFGQMHWYLFPLLILGLWNAIRKRTLPAKILLAWFFCFPFAAACTRESIPHALRSVFAVPIVQLLSVYGLKTFWEMRPRFERFLSPEMLRFCQRIWLTTLIVLPSIYLYDLFVRYPMNDDAAAAWEYGYRDAIAWQQEHKREGERTVVSGFAEYPYIFFLFYDRYPPDLWMEQHQIDGVAFVPLGQPIEPYVREAGKRIFYLTRPSELPNYQPDKVILTPSRLGIWKWVVLGNP